MRTRRGRIIVAALLFAAAVPAGYCQDPRGSLIGRVSDTSGAMIPGARVQALNKETGVAASGQTNAVGSFGIPFLLPGVYRLTAESTGFKKTVRDNIELRVAETVEVNLEMQVGAVSDSVEVTAEAPPLDTATSSLGQAVDSKRIGDLPLYGGNPMDFMLLAPGIVRPGTSVSNGKANGTNVQFTSNGTGSRSSDYQIDGVSNTFAITGQTRPAFNPPAAAVREFKVQTSSYEATSGHSTGALVNVSTTNGTNQLHGEAHWWLRNRVFDAPTFFNNKAGTSLAVYQDNRYGASLGGPVYLPKAYDGRNRTFFFYAWEANKFCIPRTYTETVPTAAEARGDFSALLGIPNGGAYQIYDPKTTQAEAGGRFRRQPFPGNVIPANRLDPVGVNLVKLFPQPNQPGSVDGRTNFFSAGKERSDYYVHMARLDHNFSEAHRIYLRLHYDFFQNDKDDNFENGINGILVNHNNRGIAFDDVVVLSSSMVFNFRYGLTHNEFPQQRRTTGYNLASLGFAPSLVNLIDPNIATVPRTQAGGFSRISNWQDGDGTDNSLTHSFSAGFDHLHGAHSLRYGGDFRVYSANRNRYPRSASPDFVFPATYTRGPLDSSPVAPLGQELASMLLGVPGGGMEWQASSALSEKYFALYFQDDLKVTRKLTLNLGLRYEFESPLTERYDRLVAGFAFDVSNPIEAQARANYARRPIPELAPDAFRVRGGFTFVNDGGNGRSPYVRQRGNLMPRFGFAYRITPKTVMRGGYGIYVESLGVGNTGALQSGFSQTTPIQASLDGGLTYVATNANPFPDGLLSPLGARGGMVTNLGQAVTAYNPKLKHPYAQRWSLGFQRQLPLNFTGEASYVANRGTRLTVSRELDNTPAQYLSTSPVRDQKTIDFLSASFPSPFTGLASTFGANMSRAALLRPYPQFTSVATDEPVGYSWYHSLQTRLERRFSQGLTLQLGYTFSKFREATEFLNPTDPMPYETIAADDRTQILSLSGVYELPFGKGRRFAAQLPKALEFALGGWQLGGTGRRQSGPPLGFGNVIFNGDINEIALPKSERSADRWFNTEAGFNRISSQQLASNIVTFPLRFSGVRGDGSSQYNFSLIKNFAMTEKAVIQFRAEVYNAWNHPSFAPPNTSPANSNFGRITAVTTIPRQWQFSLRAKF